MTLITAVNLERRQSLREQLSWKLAFGLKPLYLFLRRNRKALYVNMKSLEQMPPKSLGNDLFVFLTEHDLTLMPKIGFHDVYHVLFELDTDIKSETLLQFIQLRNGRRSLPFIASTLVSAQFYSEYWNDFYNAFKRDKKAVTFHDWDFETLLLRNTNAIRKEIFGSS